MPNNIEHTHFMPALIPKGHIVEYRRVQHVLEENSHPGCLDIILSSILAVNYDDSILNHWVELLGLVISYTCGRSSPGGRGRRTAVIWPITTTE